MKTFGKKLLIYLAIVLWFGFFACQGFDVHHDGIMLGAAALVAQGKLLFREVFSQYGPLAIWIQAVAVRFFGAEDFVIKMVTVLFYGGIYLVADNIYAPRLTRPFRWFWRAMFFGYCSFYMVPFHPWSSVYALFFMFLAAHFLLKYLEQNAKNALLWGGVFSAAAWLCRTPCGFVPLTAAALTLWFRREKAGCYGKLFGGFAVVAALFALYLLVIGAVGDYFRQCGSFIFKFVVRRGGEFHFSQVRGSFFPVIDATGFGNSFFALLPLIAFALLLVLCRKKERNNALYAQIFLTLFALGSWHQYFPVPCVRHLYWAGVPLFGVTALAAQTLWNSRQTRGFKVLLTVFVSVVALYCMIPRAFAVIQRFRNWDQRSAAVVPSLRNQMLFQSENEVMGMLYRTWAHFPPEIKKRGVLNHTPDGLFTAMFPPALPPTPMFVNWGRDVYPDYPEVIEKYIREKRPVVLTTDFETLPGYMQLCGFTYFDKPYRLLAPEN